MRVDGELLGLGIEAPDVVGSEVAEPDHVVSVHVEGIDVDGAAAAGGGSAPTLPRIGARVEQPDAPELVLAEPDAALGIDDSAFWIGSPATSAIKVTSFPKKVERNFLPLNTLDKLFDPS